MVFGPHLVSGSVSDLVARQVTSRRRRVLQEVCLMIVASRVESVAVES